MRESPAFRGANLWSGWRRHLGDFTAHGDVGESGAASGTRFMTNDMHFLVYHYLLIRCRSLTTLSLSLSVCVPSGQLDFVEALKGTEEEPWGCYRSLEVLEVGLWVSPRLDLEEKDETEEANWVYC